MLERVELPTEIMALLQANGASSPPSTNEKTLLEQLQAEAERFNRHEMGKLDGADCKLCKNRGFTYYVDDTGFAPTLRTRECECMEKRRSLRRIAQSGLQDLMERYTFDTWQTPQRWQESALRLAREYTERKEGWFLAAGRSGSGKTHICTAVCAELLKQGIPVRYVLWRDMSVQAKAVVNDDEEYARITEPLKKVRVLYIDDLFKTKAGAQVTPGDVNLAFEILNYRYNDARKMTILSTEKSLDELLYIDEATGSRIYERAKDYWLNFYDKPNWRLGK